MAKGKPSRAFLEALKQDKKRRGDEKTGGGFKTPEWFFNNQSEAPAAPQAPQQPTNALPAVAPAKGRRFTWMHLAGVGAAMVLVVSISYLAGKTQHPPQLSPPSEQIREEVPQGGVLEPLDRPLVSIPAPAPIPAGQIPATVAAETALSAGASSTERIVGMNYVVIQSYKEEKLANEAAAALRAGGLGCTVEHGLPGYSSSWYSVVGTTGFAKATTAEYQAYLKKVGVVSEKFAGASKWKRFEPNPYKWR